MSLSDFTPALVKWVDYTMKANLATMYITGKEGNLSLSLIEKQFYQNIYNLEPETCQKF